MGKIWGWIKRPSISKRLIISFLCILTIPVSALAFSSYSTAGHSLEGEIMRSANNSVDQLNKMISQNVEKRRMRSLISVKRFAKKHMRKKARLPSEKNLNNTQNKTRMSRLFLPVQKTAFMSSILIQKCRMIMIPLKGAGIKKPLRKKAK